MNKKKVFASVLTLSSLLLATPFVVQSAPPTKSSTCVDSMAYSVEMYPYLYELCMAVHRYPAMPIENGYKKDQDMWGMEGKIKGAATYSAKKQYADADKKLRDVEIKLMELTWYCPDRATKIDCKLGYYIQEKLTDAQVMLDQLIS
jgi:hypothetical protein